MRGFILGTLTVIAGLVFTAVLADTLQSWRTQRAESVAEYADPATSAGPGDKAAIRFADPATNYRPAPKPSVQPIARRE
jgi:hypothetical protein